MGRAAGLARCREARVDQRDGEEHRGAQRHHEPNRALAGGIHLSRIMARSHPEGGVPRTEGSDPLTFEGAQTRIEPWGDRAPYDQGGSDPLTPAQTRIEPWGTEPLTT